MPRRPASYLRLHGLVSTAVEVAGETAEEAKRTANPNADVHASLVTGIDAAIRDLRAARRALIATVRTCEVCGERFVGRADARYHAGACRQRAHRARRSRPS